MPYTMHSCAITFNIKSSFLSFKCPLHILFSHIHKYNMYERTLYYIYMPQPHTVPSAFNLRPVPSVCGSGRDIFLYLSAKQSLNINMLRADKYENMSLHLTTILIHPQSWLPRTSLPLLGEPEGALEGALRGLSPPRPSSYTHPPASGPPAP